MVSVRRATPDEWELMRDVRLAALRDAPGAFASTYAREAPYTEEQWRGRWLGDRVTVFFADVTDLPGPAGLAGAYVEDGVANLVSMWVRPDARRSGAGEALVNAAAGWARARGHDTLYLWVAEDNAAARRLYERCGFTPTGERQPLPSNPAVPEIRMRLPL
jgi:GNAT superfamily N-acetyltransferase